METGLAKTNGQGNMIVLNNFDPKKYNTLLPVSMEQLSPYHSMRAIMVTLSPEPSDGDVYPESGQFALRKRALEMLGDAAGIVWDTRQCRRVDDMKDDDLVVFQAVGGIRKPDGSVKVITGTKEINLRDLKKNGASDREIQGIRKHKTRLAETKAYLAAMRSLLRLKSTYTREELERPFVVTQYYLDPTKDPAIAQAMKVRFIQDMADLFGTPDAPKPALEAANAVLQLAEPKAEMGGQGMAFELPEDEDAPAEQPPSSEQERMAKADMIHQIMTLAEQKGYEWGRCGQVFEAAKHHPITEAGLDELVAFKDAVGQWKAKARA